MIIAHRRLLLQGRRLIINNNLIPSINTKIKHFSTHSQQWNSFQQISKPPNQLLQHFSNPSKKDPSKWYLIIGMAALLTIGSGFYFDTFNEDKTGILKDYKYNPEVSKYLKEAVWMESNKGNYNYSEALKYYAMALNEMPNHISKLSDAYTRIELKIAEMLERLNMFDRSKDVYNEILNRFYLALSDRSDISTKISVNERAELIRKDLRILIKSLELNQDIQFGKKNLLAHLLLVQEEILLKSPELKEFFDRKRERTSKLLKGQSLTVDDFQVFVNEENIKLDKEDNGLMILDMNKNSSAWEPFKEELFVARDLYTAYCLSSKDIASALTCKMTTVEWMVMADMPPGQILLAQANLGSLFYLQMEKLDADIEQINSKIQENPDLLKDDTIIKALRTLNKNKRNCLKMTERCYDSILNFFNKNKRLRYHIKDQLDTSILQAIALSTYGKGVLVLNDGLLAQAERLLKDAITLAKEEDFKELVNEASKELEQVQTLRLEQQHISEPQKTIS
ncbi:Mgr3p PWA37_003773 [Arxiozyma heterogenica]|uniref:Mitochondrial inner membrane i-AAA protease supercomplex subunit MGR3 n=1 Tax=Arxiozyma heterogenica TaxID=278026 RepID=A0AAN7WLD4_9SACH|nr:hypothetical protein RI543_004935 [Kazachstania heterogenica]